MLILKKREGFVPARTNQKFIYALNFKTSKEVILMRTTPLPGILMVVSILGLIIFGIYTFSGRISLTWGFTMILMSAIGLVASIISITPTARERKQAEETRIEIGKIEEKIEKKKQKKTVKKAKKKTVNAKKKGRR